jgi:eukaryotic-like serine/threonine-protein kinase
MQIRCPNCSVRFESTADTSWTNLTCPSCDASFSLSGGETTCSFRPGVRVLGRFELLQEVGAGRFGSVWKALDTQLQRMVAVKIPRQRDLGPQQTELFLRDARAAAQLRHPRIASVHEVGREDETVFIVSDFIDGANLAEWLSGTRLSFRESAELMVKIADAVHHAHETGIVHRDLKPGNIMLDRGGEPYVIDFGLARREIGEPTVTVDGQVLGTPAYMSPEQARGEAHRADRRSDVYSLGVILFKLLTDELPFRGQARMLMLQIMDEEPPSPRKLDSNIPRDLETITLKCLEKDPAKRYQTAQNLGDDLRRYLSNEPIQARPIGRLSRGWRWCKRHPDVASLSAVLLLVLLAVSIAAPIAAVQWTRLHESELRNKELHAQDLFQRAREEADAGRLAGGIAYLAAAYDLVDSDHPLNGSIRSLMSGWSSESGQPLVNDSPILAVAFSPDGQRIVVGGHDHLAGFWDAQTMMPIGQPLEHADSVRAVAFSPDGKLVLTGCQDNAAHLWDLKSAAPVGKPLDHAEQVWAVAFSADGKMAATGGRDHTARLWDVQTGASLGSPLRHPQSVCSVAFTANGRRLLTGCGDGIARVWDLQPKTPKESGFKVENSRLVYAVVPSPDGSRILAACSNLIAQIRDSESFKPVGEPLRHDHSVYAAAWSPDGRSALTGSFDNTARLWNTKTYKPIGQPLRHGDWVMSVAFSPDGRTVLTGSADLTARLWQIHPKEVSLAGASDAVISDDLNSLIVESISRPFEFWDLQVGIPCIVPLNLTALDVLAKSSDGRKALIRVSNDAAAIWEVQTGKSDPQNFRHESMIWTGCFSVDGRTLLTGGQDQRIRIWDATSGEPIGAPIRTGGIVRAVAISHNGKLILSGSSNQTAGVWDAQTGAPQGLPMRHPREVLKVAFSPDDRLALTIGSDGMARLWDVGTGKLLARPLQYEIDSNDANLEVKDGMFNSDGSSIQFRCTDGISRQYAVPLQLPNNPSFIHAWAKARAAIQLDSKGVPRQLSQAEWLEARRELASLQKAD